MLFVIAQTLAISLNFYFSEPSCSKQLNRLKYHGTFFVLIPLNLGLSPTLLPTTRLLNLEIFLKSLSEFSFLFIQGTVATEMDFKWKTKMVKYLIVFSCFVLYCFLCLDKAPGLVVKLHFNQWLYEEGC